MNKRKYTEEEVRLLFEGYLATFPSHTAAAKALEIDDSYISKILSGERKVPQNTVYKLFKLKPYIFYAEE
jgi:plasmid maintenance system antidote protein VapI